MDIDNIVVKRNPRIVFMGTPDFSVPVLDLLNKTYGVKAVVTQPDKEVGRNGKIVYSPVKKYAMLNNIVVIQLNKIKDSYEEVISLDPDLIVTCAYGQILPKEILEYPKFGCINVHASLLPKLRGGAPIHRAIINGYKKTGVTIMYMAEGMDNGDIISQSEVDILDTDTTSILHDKLSILGSKLLISTLPSILDGTCKRVSQNDSEVTFAPIIKKEDEHIDFSKTSLEVYNLIRGLNSFPGAYFYLNGKRIKVFESIIGNEYYTDKINGEIVKLYKDGIGIKTSNGVIILTNIQPEGKPRMSAKDYINGLKENIVGEIVS